MQLMNANASVSQRAEKYLDFSQSIMTNRLSRPNRSVCNLLVAAEKETFVKNLFTV